MSDFLKMIRAILIFTVGGSAGIILGWVMAYLISGPTSAERYLLGLQSYKLTGLKGRELIYFISGFSPGMTVAALYVTKWLQHQKKA